MEQMNSKEAWDAVMALKLEETRTRGMANTLVDDEITTIMATMDFFGASDNFMGQTVWDLKKARFRMFDWIASCLDGRRECGDGNNNMPIQVLTHSFLKSDANIDNFIADLRESDYQIDEGWTRINLD